MQKSRAHTLETSLKELGLSETLLPSSLRRQGPFSVSRPTILEVPPCDGMSVRVRMNALRPNLALEPKRERRSVGIVPSFEEPEPARLQLEGIITCLLIWT